jgi:signal transduction histidine kinase
VRRDQELDVGDLERRLEAVDADANRMVSLIDELMDAAHLRTGRMLTLTLAPTDLVELAHACAADAQRRATHVISTVSSEDELIGVWDRSRLERVIQNLLNNAVKYSSPGSPIEVQVRCEDAPDGPPWAVLSVRDEGVGIPADDLPRIFERFHRGGNVSATPGAGIGLSGAKQIVEQHGGTIAVESVENQGSTFTIRLPLSEE